jgi:glutathionyl-hydroquinone reductase
LAAVHRPEQSILPAMVQWPEPDCPARVPVTSTWAPRRWRLTCTRPLGSSAFLFGDRLTETDVRRFVTLVRFDAAYHGLFKCTLRRIGDYPNLSTHLERMLAIPGVAGTVNIDHIKRGYYSIKSLNPNGIVPLGPALGFERFLAGAERKVA